MSRSTSPSNTSDATKEAAGRILELVAEADTYFTPAGNDTAAASFYNHVARLAERPVLAPLRDELRDRALMGLAVKMRQQARAQLPAARIAANFMPASANWSPATVSDAQFAAQSVRRRQPGPAPTRGVTLTNLAAGTDMVVTAVAFAPAEGRPCGPVPAPGVRRV